MNNSHPSKNELKGMTVNERLVVCGLIDEWDIAVIARDKDKMISILIKAELTKEQANETTDVVLRNPRKYGF